MQGGGVPIARTCRHRTGGISWNSVTGRVTETGLVYYPPNGFDTTAGQAYLELRYQRIEFENESIEYIPLTIGYRW